MSSRIVTTVWRTTRRGNVLHAGLTSLDVISKRYFDVVDSIFTAAVLPSRLTVPDNFDVSASEMARIPRQKEESNSSIICRQIPEVIATTRCRSVFVFRDAQGTVYKTRCAGAAARFKARASYDQRAAAITNATERTEGLRKPAGTRIICRVVPPQTRDARNCACQLSIKPWDS